MIRPIFVLVALMTLSIAAVAAEKPKGAESESQAYADCGGPPIQDGHDVQPTPAHDKCLAEKQKIPLPKQAKPTSPTTPPDKSKPPQL